MLFSTISSMTGNPGQSNYVTANASLDALAHERRSRGLPAIAINWGVFADVGYAARQHQVSEHLAGLGMTGLSPAQAMEALGRILGRGSIQLGVIRIDWNQWAKSVPGARVPQRLSALVGERVDQLGVAEERGRIRRLLSKAAPEEHGSIIQAYVREQVARVLGAAAANLDVHRPLPELGLDSLMATEMQNRIESDLSMSLPMRELMQTPTITRLSEVLAGLLGDTVSEPQEEPSRRRSPDPPSETDSSKSTLVPLRAEGSRPSLFCLHPMGGHVTIYKSLVELLPPDQPVYGIQSRALNGAGDELPSFEELALEYSRVIRRHQSRGPYYLLGFSMGGFLAMAIAHILEQQHHRVAFVGLIDCSVGWT
ncbi:MAG: KR domain-containing protein, partial [Acidobacteria bacterium]|nr:KR domain-containing protein [Acidobacteriota bacterium]